MIYKLENKDCIEFLKELPENFAHSIICDPPYEINMMGKKWDNSGIAYNEEVWKEALRVLKPGGHCLAFSHARTYHKIACAIENVGFNIRDQIMWVYAQGMPKSGTLKPCHEPIVVARKPFKGSAKNCFLANGIAQYNIEACRVTISDTKDLAEFENNHRVTERLPKELEGKSLGLFDGGWKQRVGKANIPTGRYPGNIITDGSEYIFSMFPDSKGQQGKITGEEPSSKTLNTFGEFNHRVPTDTRGDTGSAARFFNSCSFSEQDVELQNILFYKKARGKERGENNTHISVKPVSLMQHLIRLVTPKGGIVVDMFMGSGSTGVASVRENINFYGTDNDIDSYNISINRMEKEYANIFQ